MDTVRANAWDDPRWRESAHAWVTERLAEGGMPPVGAIEEVRVRPWSVTHRVPTTAGVAWFKANTPECAYEAGLTVPLATWAPGRVLAPLAVDASRGWLLTADAGPTLREVVAGDRLLPTWAAMLQSYAALQRDLAAHTPEMLALGVPDHRPEHLPTRLAALLADPQVQADLGPARRAAVDRVAPDVTDWCAELSADGISATLQHDDLTDANVFPAPDGFRFFDWGDSSVAHPFGSLLVAIGFAAHLLGLEPGAPDLDRLRDAYLEPWSDLAPLPDLRRAAALACRVTRVSKALAWQRALADPAVPVDPGFRTAVADWLAELAEPPLL
ncbi:aminoglycoside phosphotransferase family protein [Actinoplanes sp. KI2]|uniref:aminoglycoside phosphotransferase family protein n=1 Tax=Actinoplanes sp. KI2 TaxID=2983315 RepID=UPI0021D5918A|nr:aminoglycoside phosphotransferase family protein [Actinoplanes sp. KI2]MCU7730417.1 aminoglycoside phosphotransferase family protein [Actinoplanes sp. KI2]